MCLLPHILCLKWGPLIQDNAMKFPTLGNQTYCELLEMVWVETLWTENSNSYPEYILIIGRIVLVFKLKVLQCDQLASKWLFMSSGVVVISRTQYLSLLLTFQTFTLGSTEVGSGKRGPVLFGLYIASISASTLVTEDRSWLSLICQVICPLECLVPLLGQMFSEAC